MPSLSRPSLILHACSRVDPTGMGTTHLIGAKPLKAAAEKRAAKLRGLMMVRDAVDASAPASPEARSVESHARRGLKFGAVVAAS